MLPVKIIVILSFVFSSLQAKAITSDTLIVIFDKLQFVQGDSIEMEVYTDPFSSSRPAQTLHLVIENIKTGQRWKYRYPYLKGRYKFTLHISKQISDGVYAFNFLVQQKFLLVKGKLKNNDKGDEAVNYVATTKNKAPIIDDVVLDREGNFLINNLFYTDSVYFGFSPVQKSKTNHLKIALETPLDSAFTSDAIFTELITIGNTAVPDATVAGKSYVYTATGKKDKALLDEVVLTAKQKTRRQKYENENVSALFSSDNARTFDFYENDELRNYPDIYSYLTANVAGIISHNDEETGNTILYWRKEKVNIYVDEVLDAGFSPLSLSVQDIEMVKIFSPGSRLGLDGFGGSVAIYTRRMSSRSGNKLSNYSFYVKGYTQKIAEWK